MTRRREPSAVPSILRASSRAVTADDLAQIRRLIAAHPAWGRQALSLHLARVWDWRRPDGTLSHRACRHLLGRLAAQGLLPLPPPQSWPGPRRRPPPAPPAGPATVNAHLKPYVS